MRGGPNSGRTHANSARRHSQPSTSGMPFPSIANIATARALGDPSHVNRNTPDPPVNLLSDELLAEIFVASQPQNSLVRPNLKLDFTSHAVHLSSVCRRWRVVATSTPSLWSQIFLCRPIGLPFAELCGFRRSKNTPDRC